MEQTHSVNSFIDHKLVNFNVPKYLIKNFDTLIKFKRISRTSMLIHLMENYIRVEHKRMENDNKLNLMIDEVEVRNRKSIKDKLVGLHREIEEEFEPPMIPMSNDHNGGWEESLSDDNGTDRLWKL